MTESSDRNIIYNLFKEHLRSIGVVSIALRTRGQKRYFLIGFILVALPLILWGGFPLWIFLIAIIPLIASWVLYIVDLNIMIQCLVKIQKILIEQHNLVYDLNQLLDELHEYAKENNFFQIGSR